MISKKLLAGGLVVKNNELSYRVVFEAHMELHKKAATLVYFLGIHVQLLFSVWPGHRLSLVALVDCELLASALAACRDVEVQVCNAERSSRAVREKSQPRAIVL